MKKLGNKPKIGKYKDCEKLFCLDCEKSRK